jgi:hypothetical protein
MTEFDKNVAEIRSGIAFYEARREVDLAKAITEMRANFGFPDKEQPVEPKVEPNPFAWKYSVEAAIEKRRRELGLTERT